MLKWTIRKLKFSIRLTVVSVFVLATTITAAIAISLQYYFSEKLSVNSTVKLFDLTTHNTITHLANIDNQAKNIAKILAKNPLFAEDNVDFDTKLREQFAQVMQSTPLFYALYTAEQDGDFYELVNLNTSQTVRKQLNAIQSDRWVEIKVEQVGGQRVKQLLYYDENFNLRIKQSEVTEYDPRQRIWYTQANQNRVNKTPPYLFTHLQAPGQTFSIKVNDRVIAVDIALSAVSEYLQKQGLQYEDGLESEIYVFQPNGEIVASNRDPKMDQNFLPPKKLNLDESQRAVLSKYPVINVSNEMDWPPMDFSVAGEPQGYSIDLLKRVSQVLDIRFNFVNGYTWVEFIEQFDQGQIDILQPVFNSVENHDKGLLSQAIVNLPFAVITPQGPGQIEKLSQLNGKTLAIPAGWSVVPAVEEHFPEIELILVKNTKDLLEKVARGEVDAGLDNRAVLEYTERQYFIKNIQYHDLPDFSKAYFTDSLHLLIHPDKQALHSLINLALDNISADYKDWLRQKWLAEQSSQVETIGTVPYVELISLSKQKLKHNQINLIKVQGKEKYVYISPLYQNHQLDTADYMAFIVDKKQVLAHSRDQIKVSIFITAIALILIIPVSWYFASPIVMPIKRLTEETEKIKNREFSKITTLKSNIIEIEALAKNMVKMGRSVEQHEKDQKALIESFIQLIAQAIDDKSPYTAGHCERVPQLGILLAKAASESKDKAFTDFEFNNEDEFREFRIAAWLHDCGKITTPEHIVDKGTKLETIYNRIHEIRMRFEVLWRDAEIEYYQALAKPVNNPVQLKNKLNREQHKLRQDFAFIAGCNVGGEFMDEANIERLNELAQITWLRHFDDKIGLSPVEELRAHDDDEQLPITENLLADKPEHLIAHDKKIEYDAKLGIKTKVPEYKYNQGELYNLSIGRGTLSAEDRFKINEHIISTIKMLDQVPFPAELSKVPRYASTHHETLKGTGYPRQLTADDLSIPERVLVLADIFEALTAADRPYKKAKPLSVSIDILYKMVLDDHVDADVFKLFLTSGIYLDYANTFLDPKQIDEVDVQSYLDKL